MLHRPHSIAPSKESVRVVLAYKSYVSDPNVSHIGLGVSAVNTQQVLRRNGIHAEVWGVSSAVDLDAKLVAAHRGAVDADHVRISHVVISAPWLKTSELTALLSRFTDIDFAVISHSNIGFLVVEPGAISLITEGISLQQAWHNFKLGANSAKFCDWMMRVYGNKPAYLPNLYNLAHTDGTVSRPPWRHGTLRIGSFGAIRVLKNHISAAAAAIEISRRLGVDTEFWLSGGRSEHAGPALDAITRLIRASASCKLKTLDWKSWPDFNKELRVMNLLLQPSFTESFNMVSADGVAQGVPSVVSDAIEWVPKNWQARADDACDISNVGISLLFDPTAAAEGRVALAKHNRMALQAWIDYLVPTLDS